MGRMFLIPTPQGLKPMKTWNCFVGCGFECIYCNARKAALTRFKHIARYSDGFAPKLVEEELRRRFKSGQFVFICYMGDLAFATREQFLTILARIRQFPETYFLIQTKNPKHFFDWREDSGMVLPPNVYLGTTIESNRDYGLTKAPPPVERFRYLAGYPHNFKFLSIEPVMDFDLDELTNWAALARPNIIEVGADNYFNHLVEPSSTKLRQLLSRLKKTCPIVIEKEGLERLL